LPLIIGATVRPKEEETAHVNNYRKSPQSQVQSRRDFTAQFGELVLPDLKRLCRCLGPQVAEGRSFDSACSEVLGEANRRGAYQLTQRSYAFVVNKVIDWLSDATEKALEP
jgi:hypothetical protein